MNFVENSSFSHPVYAAYLPTPLGEMLAMSSDAGVCLLAFLDEKGFEKECVAVQNAKRAHLVWQDNAHLSILREELREYFSGSLKDFSVPVDFVGTPFQQSVWRILQTIPYGKTLVILNRRIFWRIQKRCERLPVRMEKIKFPLSYRVIA